MSESKVLKLNKHAKFKYTQDETLEAGLVLTGLDVKDFKNNRFEIRDSFVRIESGEAYVYNIHFDSSPDLAKKRKLLLHKRELQTLEKTLQIRKNNCYVLSAKVNPRGLVKLILGIGTIKKKNELKSSDKRMTQKRDTERYIAENI